MNFAQRQLQVFIKQEEIRFGSNFNKERDRAKALRLWLYLYRKYAPDNAWGSYLRVMVELTGIEPVSEKKSTRVSPGAVCLQNSRRARPANRPALW